MFKKRPGTTDRGKEYEDHLVALIALNLSIDDDVQDFELFSNDPQYGSFDDIVCKITYTDGRIRKSALQLKHVTGKRCITSDSLAEKKGDFSLQKYCEEFNQIDCLKNCECVLYTNKLPTFRFPFELKEKSYVKITGNFICQNGDPFNTGPKDSIAKFDTKKNTTIKEEEEEVLKYETFFSNFSLYGSQQNVDQLKTTIEEIFKREFDCEDASPFFHFIESWSKYDGKKDKLNKFMVRSKLAETVLEPFVKIVPFGKPAKEVEILRNIIDRFDITIFENLDGFVKLWLDQTTIPKNNGLWIKFGRNERNEKDKFMILWHLNLVPLFLEVTKSNEKRIEKVVQLCKGTKKYVLIGQDIDRTQLVGTSVFQNLNDLDSSESYYKNLLENATVSLQGRKEITLNQLIEVNSSIAELITPKYLLKMLEDNLEIGESKQDLPDCYITRHFPKILIKYSFLNECSTDVTVISCRGRLDKVKQKLTDVHLVQLEKHVANKNNEENENNSQKMVVYYHEDGCSEEQFQEFCQMNAKQNCHHLQVTNKKNLQWISSNGSQFINTLRPYISMGEYYQDSEIFNMCKSKFNIITGEAGVGKSVVLKYLKKNYSSDHWVLNFNFGEQCFNLKENYTEDVLESVCKFAPFDTQFNIFEENLKNIFVKKRKVVILWDGIDELSKKHLPAALKTLEELHKLGVVQWVTTRFHLKSQLEEKFQVFSLTMRELSLKEQKDYVMRRLPSKGVAEIEKVCSSTCKELQEFVGIPMQLYMLTDLFIRNPNYSFEKILSLADIFEYFFKERLKYIFQKADIYLEIPLQRDLYKCLKAHQKQYLERLALKTLFGEEIFGKFFSEMFCEVEEIIKSNGDYLDIVSVDESGRIVFRHNVFAEYFAGSWLSENFDRVKNLNSFFFEEKFKNVRLMFDMIVAKECPAHLSVLRKDLKLLQQHKESIFLKDKCGRNPLHLVCSWGETHNLLDTKKSGDKLIINLSLRSTIKEEDKDFDDIMCFLIQENCDPFEKDKLSLNAIEYADISYSLRALENILKSSDLSFSELSKFQDDCSVLSYAVACNYERIFSKFRRIPYFEDERTHMSLIHLCALLNRPYFLKDILRKGNKYLKRIDNEQLYLGGVTFMLPQVNISSISFPSLLITIKNIQKLEVTALDLASMYGRTEVVDILLKNGANCNFPSPQGMTPLHWASSGGFVDIVRMLMEAGADKNSQFEESNYRTPLHYATIDNKLDVVKCLCSRPGTEQLFDEPAQYIPLDYAAKFGYVDIFKYMAEFCEIIDVNKSLIVAAEFGQLEIVKYLIKQKKINIGFHEKGKNSGVTALHLACQYGYFQVVKFLVANKADIDRQDDVRRCTALHYSASKGFSEIIKFLVENNANFTLVDKQKQTVLHYAVAFGDVEIIEFLVQRGADIWAADSKGNTAVSLAKEHENADVRGFFIKYLNKNDNNR